MQNLQEEPGLVKPVETEPEASKKKKEEKGKKKREQKTGRNVEIMFRITSRNHMDLSDMADRKANLLISINTLILSVVGSILLTKFDDRPYLIMPTTILVIVSLSTITLGIFATRPKVSTGKFTKEQIENKEVNLFFFGNFYNMPLENFRWAIHEMIHDNNYMYDAMTKDIYISGKVVARKYRFLHMAYNVFMYGLIVAVVAFVISLLVSGTATIK